MAIIVAIPLGVIAFLYLFGQNRLTLPVYFAEDSSLTVQGKFVVTSAHSVPDFQFINQNGNVFSSEALKGKIWIANFVFTRCPTICPKMTTQLTRVQETFEKDTSLKIVSFTVDPSYDTAAVLKTYANSYKADENRWTFLTGDKEKIYNLGQKGFFITTMEDTVRPLEFLHSEKLVLVDKKGWIRGYYNGTDREEVDKLITEVKVLQEMYQNPE
ncbi:MAG: SCO family protein [Cytophagaceae bacterium]|jgi:protein SCO1/2|nr:SCO family protein [Cytophagaceae bacterium]